MTSDGIIERPRAVRSAARRRHLLETARTLFAEKGFHQTGMAQIASASGIAVGQIYRDFSNKEAIIAAICEADLASWLEEERLKEAVAKHDRLAIQQWIEKIALEEPTCKNRRMMCELLAEVGRNALIAEMTRKVDARLRTSLEAALVSLAPHHTPEHRADLMDFIVAISWGMVARIEMDPTREHQTLRRYVASLLREKVGITHAD